MASILTPFLSLWISLEIPQVIPDSWGEVWHSWDLRISVLASCFCQYTLLALGKKRKQLRDVGSTVWVLYLASDWVLNLSLGMISNKIGEGENNQALIAFWSTILLVHIGGPPTITAEALEDNALWHRTFFLWIIQTGRALYIVFSTWRSNQSLSYLSIGMLLVGLIKTGEKAWAQYYASFDNLHDKKSKSTTALDESDPRYLFETFKRLLVSLFKDFVLSDDDLEKGQNYFRKLNPESAFKYVDVQLGYAYDVLYTKAYVMFSLWGRVLCFCTSSIIFTMSIFFLNASETTMHGVSKPDRVTTYILVGGVAFSEVYIVEMQLFSNWNKHLSEVYILQVQTVSNWNKYIGLIIDNFSPADAFNMSWKNTISKCNLLSFFLQFQSYSVIFLRFMKTETTNVDENLRKYIFTYLLKKKETWGLKSMEWPKQTESMEWAKQIEFHQSILTWHIATHLCWHATHDADVSTAKSKMDISMDLSGYMLYLLVKQRHMLPIGRGVITVPATCDERLEFLGKSKAESDSMPTLCEKLLHFNPNEGTRGRSTSALSDACRLARSLINEMETEQRWEFLGDVWTEILGYAATRCRPEEHAQQLRRGGEFLTHVWLLMAHLGLVEQFQIMPTSEEQLIVQITQPGGRRTGTC